jgi:hypothetical protein
MLIGQTVSISWFDYLRLGEDSFAEVSWCWLTKRYWSAEAADTFWETKMAAMYKTTGHDRPIIRERLFSYLWYRTLPGPFLGRQLHMKILSRVAVAWPGFVMVRTSASFSEVLDSSPIPDTQHYDLNISTRVLGYYYTSIYAPTTSFFCYHIYQSLPYILRRNLIHVVQKSLLNKSRIKLKLIT